MDIKQIALSRTQKLLALARETYSKDKALAKRYVELARKIASKHRMPLGSKDFCRKCSTIFIPGVTVVIRTNAKEKMVRYICKNCGTVRRFGYAREKTAARKSRRNEKN
ncbi:MAG TPA: hypothetical protein VGQ00_00350 [Candidatus Norongarragalinales archaeon]|jgi:ribonuclease P protein subunit RPR2|nr:hypothetical protein [Candidatus Norongarragalinales archaeon]